MNRNGVLPDGEHVRLALRWLLENAPVRRQTIDEASQRFDLSPREVEFFLQKFPAVTDRDGEDS